MKNIFKNKKVILIMVIVIIVIIVFTLNYFFKLTISKTREEAINNFIEKLPPVQLGNLEDGLKQAEEIKKQNIKEGIPKGEESLAEEGYFKKAINIVWSGKIGGEMGCSSSGCEAYWVELIPQIDKYQEIYLWPLKDGELETDDNIIIYGSWTGITCGYWSVFGQCIPEVVPQKIEKMDVK